jgi:sulfide-dependent adenosine diphosphate thiazole synthase
MNMAKGKQAQGSGTLSDIVITRKIFEQFAREFSANLEVDVVIAGGGPSGLVAARDLARDGHRVVLFERKLSIGGGMWGGGMTFPTIVVRKGGRDVIARMGVRCRDAGEGYYTADSIECVAKLTAAACDAGARIFPCVSVEDVMYYGKAVCGVVINWTAVEMAGLHVDPLCVGARAVIDATGHPSEVCHIVERKTGKLDVPGGKVLGERSMWATVGERTVVENTRQVFPGLWVAGMAANAVAGAPRMGPIFDGMILSGVKVARLVASELK